MLKKNSCFIFDVKKSTKINNSSQRAVSEIIGAMLLLGITVAGGILVWGLIQGNEVLNYAEEDQELNPQVINKLKIIGYDTRDALNLYNIGAIDNDDCSSSCDGLTEDEYIIIKVRNDNTKPVVISTITINEIQHSFDSDNTNNGGTFSSSSLPMATGQFVIISAGTTLLQEPSSTIPSGSEKRIVLQLDLDGASSIALNSKLRVVINSSAETTKEYLIPGGTIA